jgi:hypothetical protein
MHGTPRRMRSRSRAALVWALALFVVGQGVLGLLVSCSQKDIFDPEYNLRLDCLQVRRAEAPDRPLALIVGSSRTANGLHPASVHRGAALDDRERLLFNFSLLGAGPVRELLTLRRLLAAGVRPDWLFIEVWPPYLTQAGWYREEPALGERIDLYWVDVPSLVRLYHDCWQPIRSVVARAAAPAVHARMPLVDRYAGFLLPRSIAYELRNRDTGWRTLDDAGWLAMPLEREDPAAFRRRLDTELKPTMKPLLDAFRVHEVADRALRELLDLGRAHGILTAFVLLPEHSGLRDCYPAATQAALAAYLHKLGAEYRTPALDLRDWSSDDDFTDPVHLSVEGARAFSERFGREIYGPLLRGHHSGG